jgi:putative membrane protein
MVRSLLSDADARAVEAAVTRVESTTAAELVVAVVPRSHDYWQGRVVLAVAWALAAALAGFYGLPFHDPSIALLLEVVVGVAGFVLAGWPPLLRLLISEGVAQQAAQARAYRLFAERGLHGTRGRTALLVFVSELEHRVVLLGDRSIDALLGQAGWDGYVAGLVRRIRAGQAREGLLELLDQLEPQLAAVAPRAEDDVNELPDAVLRS